MRDATFGMFVSFNAANYTKVQQKFKQNDGCCLRYTARAILQYKL